jgi:uncharacterized protein YndB with AHSA1/START domain
MVKIEKSIVIAAPVEEVFAYASDPRHTPEYFTGVHEVTDVRRLPNGGYTAKTAYRIAGLHTDVIGEDIEFVPNARIVAQNRSALDDMKLTATFERLEGGKTRVTCIEEHTLHGGFLGKLGETFLTGYLEHAAEMTQATMKARIEAGIPAGAAR